MGTDGTGAGFGVRECVPLFLSYTKSIDFFFFFPLSCVERGAEEYLISAPAAGPRHLDQGLSGPWRRCEGNRGRSCPSPRRAAWASHPLPDGFDPSVVLPANNQQPSPPMRPRHRHKNCSSGSRGQEVRGGSRTFILKTTLLRRAACQCGAAQ